MKKLKAIKVYWKSFRIYNYQCVEFYRNPDQWYILETKVLPELFDKFGNNLKIWSAACSTGDEPYSLVMLLDKLLPNNRIRILATDIDQSALDKAKLGLYNIKSLKSLPDEFKEKYFEKVSDKTYRISDKVKIVWNLGDMIF